MDKPTGDENTGNKSEVVTAEHIFATTAFNILDENALFNILARLNPVSILSLCQSNRQFAKLCSQKTTFARLMTLHYPQHPLDVENPKERYVDITANIGVVYSVDIIGYRKMIRDSRGNDIFVGYEFDDKAYANPKGMLGDEVRYGEREVLSFRMTGTKIRRREVLWLAVEHKGNQLTAKVYPTKEEAVDHMDIFTDSSGNSWYGQALHSLRRKFITKSGHDYAYWATNPMLTVDEPRFSAYLATTNYPFPFTLEGIYNYILVNNVFNLWSSRIREKPDVYAALMDPAFKTHAGDEIVGEMQEELNELHVFHVLSVTIL